MNGKSKNEGVHIIADFKDRAVPLSNAPQNHDRLGTRSKNEGVHVLAVFTEPALPLTGSEFQTNPKENSPNSAISPIENGATHSSFLKDRLSAWTDIDSSTYELAVCLGLMKEDQGQSVAKAKHDFRTTNPIGNLLVEMLDSLVTLSVLEKRDETELQYRWNSHFKGSWE